MSGKRIGSLLVDVGADTRDLNRSLDDSAKRVKQFSNQVAGSGRRAQSSFAGMSTSAQRAGASAGSSFTMLGAFGGLARFAGPAAGAAAAFGGARMIDRSLQGAARFSPEAVNMRTGLQLQRDAAQRRIAAQAPGLVAASANKADIFELMKLRVTERMTSSDPITFPFMNAELIRVMLRDMEAHARDSNIFDESRAKQVQP